MLESKEYWYIMLSDVRLGMKLGKRILKLRKMKMKLLMR
jgi:hypothetical protein